MLHVTRPRICVDQTCYCTILEQYRISFPRQKEIRIRPSVSFKNYGSDGMLVCGQSGPPGPTLGTSCIFGVHDTNIVIRL